MLLLFSVWDSHLSPSKSWECVIFGLGAAKISNGVSFTETTYFQGATNRVEDERVVEK
jgi:hypothetical protein